MARPFPLQLVLDLTERRAEAKSREVRLAHAAWLRARTQVVRMQQQRARYNAGLSARFRQGCPAGAAKEAGEALRNYQKRLTAGMQMIESAHAAWLRTLESWQAEKKRLEALQMLARRHAMEEARRDAKQERRLHDELASKAAYLRMPSQQRETGFLFAEAERAE
jgi:flagellar export protein FliJ